jgi:hypothetical protein
VAEYATRHAKAHVTGVTLSGEQLAFAQERLRTKGLHDQAELRLQDYRDLNDEPFDAVVSIEMFEAVGREYWPGFFRKLNAMLKPGARACIQSITIRDDLFTRYVNSTDFIQQYIFPGGLLPSKSMFREQAAELWPRLCRNPAPVARALSGPRSRCARPAFRHPLHAHLGVLPGLLRGRVCHRQHRCRAVHTRAAVTCDCPT